MVSKGVPVETMQVVDSMGRRTLLQRLAFVGVNTDTRTLSVAKGLEWGVYANIGNGLEDVEATRILDKYSGALQFIHSLDTSGKIQPRFMAVMARAYYTQDRDKLKDSSRYTRVGFPQTHLKLHHFA